VRRVFVAGTLAEAHLMLQLLGESGIRGKILNQYSQGGVGDLAATEVLPEVWVYRDDDETLARKVIKSYHRVDLEKVRVCKSCGESNPTTFELCWQCSGALEE
tara:strand:+ start:289 stop:597 length:309 start_codon:yes stop_codon:yes gene_type:complete